VNWVNYPGLDPVGKRRIAKYFSQPLGSGILTFGLKGDRKAIGRFAKNLKVAALVVHIGDARTSVLHPASSTHAQLNEEQLRAAGITPDLIRVSVGIEDVQDLTADFAQALAASNNVSKSSFSVQPEIAQIAAATYLGLASAPERLRDSIAIEVSLAPFARALTTSRPIGSPASRSQPSS